MDFAFTEDQAALRRSFKDFLSKEYPGAALRKAFDTGRLTPGLWEKIAAFGVFGLMVPEALGGLGLSAIEAMMLMEEGGYVGLPEPVLETAFVAAPFLAAVQETKVLEAVISGEKKIAVAFLEQPYVAYGPALDLLLRETAEGWYLCEGGVWQSQAAVDGAYHVAKLVQAPQKQTLLASGSEGKYLGLNAYYRAALGTASNLVGLGQKALHLAIAYSKTREQFGVAIGSFQALKHKMADAHLALEFARPQIAHAAFALREKEPDAAQQVFMAKIAANEAAQLAAETALTVHGAIGYSFECDLHLFMKRIWCLSQTYGTTADHEDKLARAIGI